MPWSANIRLLEQITTSQGVNFTAVVHSTVMDDAQLVTQAQAGSDTAYCELVERHQSKAMSIAYGLLGNLEEAKDASQEAFVKAYRGLTRFRSHAKFSTWLYRIVVNECQDALRARNRTRRWLWFPTSEAGRLGDEDADFLALIPSDQPSARDAMQDVDVKRMLQQAVTGLSPRQRAVVTLRYFEGLSLEDVADTLGCATGTVKAQLARALRHLRTQLNGVLEEVSVS